MKKRIISMLMVAIMSTSVLAGCGKKETTKDVAGNGQTITVGLPQSANVTSYEDNALTTYIEETLDIKLKFTYFSSSSQEYSQQLSLMVTGGQKLPDVILGFQGMDHYTVNQFGEDGYFLDLTNLIEDYAPNYKAAYDKLTKDQQNRITKRGTNAENGEFYGMPYMVEKLQDNVQGMTYINKTWLDKLGLQMPSTIDELYNVCKAFATQDPNGNGKVDEIPILAEAKGTYDITTYLVNAFVYYDTLYSWNAEDGKVYNPCTTDEYRDALIYANKFCKEGLLSELCFSLASKTEFISMITPSDNVSRVGIWAGHPALYTSAKAENLNEYVALPALSGATSKGGYDVVRPEDLAFCSFITNDCETPELAMKLLDLFYLDETVTRVRHGEKDVDWVYEEGVSSAGHECYAKVINGNAFFSGNDTWCANMHGFLTVRNYISWSDEVQGRNAEVNRLTAETWDILRNAKAPEEVVNVLVYNNEEYEKRTELASLYNDYINEQRNLFISGEQNPNDDAAWNVYLSNMEKLGASTLLDIAQSAYERGLE